MVRRLLLCLVTVLLAGASAGSAFGQSGAAPAPRPDPGRFHLVGLRNGRQADEVRRAFGERALWSWDAAAQQFRRISDFRPAHHVTLYTLADLAAKLHLDLAPRHAVRAPAVSKPTTTNKPVTASPPGSPLPLGGVAGPWHLLFDDEFSSDSLDTSLWTPYWFSDGSVSNETTMLSSNVSVSNGTLNLTLGDSSGALVSTNGKFQFTYGYVEARIDLPAAGSQIANWPAFWTDGQSWPTDGEMDVMEGLGGSACYHFHSDAGGPGGCAAGEYSGWHTYGAYWQPGSVTYYYDGKDVGTITDGITAQPMYLILENSGGSYGGSSQRPAVMRVDYVRVWQH